MILLDKLISIIAPTLCVRCSKEGSVVCAWCSPELIPLIAERCISCNALSENSRTCKDCRRKHKLPKHVWTRSVYEDFSKLLLGRLKFQRSGATAKVLASLMAEPLPYLSDDTLITHVPTSPARIRQRGYDQSRLLAKELAKQNNVRYTAMLSRLSNVRQVGSSRIERKKQLQGAFYLKRVSVPKKTPILLVDDIYTTGGTLSAATVTLRQAGYKNVNAVVFAKVL